MIEDVRARLRTGWLPAVALIGFAGASAPVRVDAVTVEAFWLPTRRIDTAERTRLKSIAAAVAKQLGATLISAPAAPGLRESVAHARSLMVQGALDDAAALLDRTLAERSIDRLDADDQADWIAGTVRRVSLALARGEVGRARQLLARLLRFDPGFALAPGENTPPLRAALADVRSELGIAPPIPPADLEPACRSADVLLVARAMSTGVQVIRFDACAEIARAELEGGPIAIAELAHSQAAAPPRAHARKNGRVELIAGAALAVAGLALASTGSYFAERAASREAAIDRDCTVASPCASPDLHAWIDEYDTARIAASALLPIGAAALAAGSALLVLGARRHRGPTTRALAPAHPHALLEATWAF
jgi:hypothetical protein